MQEVRLSLCMLLLLGGTSMVHARGGGGRGGGHSHGGSHSGAVHVSGYTRANGTHVAPYVRSAPDGSRQNNLSAKSNKNPYTGKVGTVNPDYLRADKRFYSATSTGKTNSEPNPYPEQSFKSGQLSSTNPSTHSYSPATTTKTNSEANPNARQTVNSGRSGFGMGAIAWVLGMFLALSLMGAGAYNLIRERSVKAGTCSVAVLMIIPLLGQAISSTIRYLAHHSRDIYSRWSRNVQQRLRILCRDY